MTATICEVHALVALAASTCCFSHVSERSYIASAFARRLIDNQPIVNTACALASRLARAASSQARLAKSASSVLVVIAL